MQEREPGVGLNEQTLAPGTPLAEAAAQGREGKERNVVPYGLWTYARPGLSLPYLRGSQPKTQLTGTNKGLVHLKGRNASCLGHAHMAVTFLQRTGMCFRQENDL